jgi:hypothetical protein
MTIEQDITTLQNEDQIIYTRLAALENQVASLAEAVVPKTVVETAAAPVEHLTRHEWEEFKAKLSASGVRVFD